MYTHTHTYAVPYAYIRAYHPFLKGVTNPSMPARIPLTSPSYSLPQTSVSHTVCASHKTSPKRRPLHQRIAPV